MNVVAIVQARMGSSRLPGKVRMHVGYRPPGKRPVAILTHVLARARAAGVTVVVTTTPDRADDVIVSLCFAAGVPCTRGQTPLGAPGKNDVLSGYAAAATAARADAVVRITSDCPLLDPRVVRAVLDAYVRGRAQYACNVQPPSWYDGCDVEVFSAPMLYRAADEADATQREHVTTWMRQRWGEMRGVNVVAPGDFSSVKLSVDDESDLTRVRRTYAMLRNKTSFTWRDVVIAYHYAHPTPALRRALRVYGGRPGTERAMWEVLSADLARGGMTEIDAARVRQLGLAYGAEVPR